MKYDVILTSTASILTERGKDYGDPNICFGRIAKLASVFFERQVTEYEIAMIMHFVKLGRIMESPHKVDNWQDLVNYDAFAGHFATEAQKAVEPEDVGLKGVSFPSSVSHFATKRSPKAASAPAELHRSGAAISEDALRQAMDAVSAELDVVEN